MDPKWLRIHRKNIENVENSNHILKIEGLLYYFFFGIRQKRKMYEKNGRKGEKSDPGGAAWRHAWAGGEDPRRGIRTAPGQDCGKGSRQELRSLKNLAAI